MENHKRDRPGIGAAFPYELLGFERRRLSIYNYWGESLGEPGNVIHPRGSPYTCSKHCFNSPLPLKSELVLETSIRVSRV